ncbi:MAG: hydroxyacid dehydrogenase [Sphaerochaetaceae bacterium]|nr:hydroxyacid dehydrogenase [Sphaerochaetaceae bacterium]
MLILIADAFDKGLPAKLSVFGEVTDDISRLPEADVVLIRSKTKATKEYIDQAKNMKVILRGGVGMDNIDRAYCKEKGIIAMNTPHASAPAVAELAFALMLSTAARICFYDNSMKKGEWAKKEKRTELLGKTLGLIGFGNISKSLAQRAKAFGMNVVYYDIIKSDVDYAEYKSSMDEVVENADYISFHIPYTPETDKVLNKDLIAKMKKAPVIINTARGKIVNEQDVADALKEGKLSWYCTDVYTSEPPVMEDNPLFKAERVTFTPHVGANSKENLLRIGDEVYETIEKYHKEGII